MSLNHTEVKTAGTVFVAAAVFYFVQWGNAWLDRIVAYIDPRAAHMLLETIGFAICFSLLVLGWLIFVPTLCRQRLIIAALFSAIGLLDVLHALSSEGFPLYDPAVGDSPSIVLNWIAQSIGAVGLLIVFAIRNRIVKPGVRKYAILPVVISVAAVSFFVFQTGHWDPVLLDKWAPIQHISTLVFYATAIGIILYRHRYSRPESMLTIVLALVWLFFAKLEQTLGTGSSVLSSLLADGFKLAGYYCLLKGIYLVLIEEPYRKKRKVEERMNHLVYHDELTSLPNRRMFTERVAEEMRLTDLSGRPFALLWLDIDRFKTINDSMGHAVGDRLLFAIAARLTEFSKPFNHVFRLGGDEFTVLLRDIRAVEEAMEAGRRLVKVFEQPFEVGPSQFHITSSIGIALYPEDGKSLDLLLQNADTAMYNAKSARNSWKRYELWMNLKAREKLMLENDLHKALELGQFALVYQPLVDLEREVLVGAEALLRWQHPDKGNIAPADFIPLCEESGLIIRIGEWVLKEACTQMKAWQDSGFPPIVLSVNLSIRQFLQHDLCERIATILQETGLDAHWLELEITESMMADVAFATEVLGRIKKLGLRISIDDFGTGYSSFNYLKRFPIDKLKIDRSFMHDVLNDRNDAAIVAGISAMARNMDLKVTAEGVESAAQVTFLKGLQCQEAQGFFYSRPVASDRFVRLLERDKEKRAAAV